MVTVFDVFGSVSYKYLLTGSSTIEGDVILSANELTGIFKLRNGMIEGDRELRTSDATLHVHPEDFEDPESIVGNGILYDGVFYEIVGCTAGTNFNTHKPEFYRLTLEVKKYANEAEYLPSDGGSY